MHAILRRERGVAVNRAVAARLLAGSAFAAALPGRARADEPPLVVAVTPSSDAVPFYYAQSAGLFDKAGLTVKAQTLGSGATIASAVGGGAADVGFSNVVTIIEARSKGIPFVILAGGGEYNDANPTSQMLVRVDSPLRTAKDLEGKIVVVGALHDLQSLSTQAWMAANGADPAKVQFIESPASAAPALLAQKRADAIVVSEPNLHNAVAGGIARVFANPYTALSKRLPVSAWFCTQTLLTARPDAAKRFTDAMHRASDYVNAHTDELNPLISDYSKIPVATLHDMRHAQQAPTVDAGELQAMIDAAAKFHAIDKSFPAKDLIGA